jgi:glycosyltransferase involved in cell wall biosynthesis
MTPDLLSVIIPAYNEAASIERTIRTVAAVVPRKEIVVLNDGSCDDTKQIIDRVRAELEERRPQFLQELKVVHKARNEGKGAAIRTALELVSGDIVLIQDADLELDPHDYPRLLEPFQKLDAAVVFGSRFRREGIMRVHGTVHFLGNKALTWFSNLFTGLYVTDMETCYKAFRLDLLRSFSLKSNRFGIEPELTAKVARAVKRQRLNFYEVPVSYRPRTYAEGKKIGLRDAATALVSVVYFNLFDRWRPAEVAPEPALTAGTAAPRAPR